MTVQKIPLDVRKACMMLGLDPNSTSRKLVIDSWKALIAQKANPNDPDAEVETAIMYNTAKDTVIRWLDENAT